ncbi:MAG: sn-glycerol-3-phosphate import ATP-binding protein UgpC [Vulcanimicrobiaceae bacterium]
MATLRFDHVAKSYDGKHVVLRGIDMAVADGEFVVIVGPSGCGKSTLLRMVAGLESVTSGEIRIGETVVNSLEPKDRDIAMVFQNYALYPHMNVFDNMAYGLKIRGLDRTTINERVNHAATILELELLLTRRPRHLSGGQRQRVAMGRAIVREPAVFLFDEPLSNLDAKLRVQMRLQMKELHARLSTTTLYVTHDQVEAMTLAQRVMVLNAGNVEQIGTPVEIYERPATTFVADFIGSPAMNLIPGRLTPEGSFESAGAPPIALALDGARRPAGEVILGIRPEHIVLTDARNGGSQLTLPVDVCELLGADNLAHGRWGKQPLTVRLPHERRPAAGDVLPLAFPAAALHLFDPKTEKRIGP